MSVRDVPLAVYGAHMAAALAEGFCPQGHPLTPARLHGENVGSCNICGASWCRDELGLILGSACVPGDHTCGEQNAVPPSG